MVLKYVTKLGKKLHKLKYKHNLFFYPTHILENEIR